MENNKTKTLAMCFLDVDPRPPPIIHQGPQNQTLPVNSVAMLHCTCDGNPAPAIRWLRNGRNISPNDARMTVLDSGMLQISGKLINLIQMCCVLNIIRLSAE